MSLTGLICVHTSLSFVPSLEMPFHRTFITCTPPIPLRLRENISCDPKIIHFHYKISNLDVLLMNCISFLHVSSWESCVLSVSMRGQFLTKHCFFRHLGLGKFVASDAFLCFIMLIYLTSKTCSKIAQVAINAERHLVASSFFNITAGISGRDKC